jgi:hypothetical protein
MIKFPEVALICGTALVANSNTSLGISLIGIAFVCAFAKWTIQTHLLRQEQETKSIMIASFSEIVGNLLTSMGKKYAPSSRTDGTLH